MRKDRMARISWLSVLGLMLGVWSSLSFGQIEPPKEPERPVEEVATKIGEDQYRIGKAVVDRKKEEITLEGKVNMQEGLVELLACTPTGKLHESVLVLDVEPIHLQTCLLLLGMEYGRNLKYQGDPTTPLGDPVEIWVEWKVEDTEYKHRGEDLVLDVKNNKTMEQTNWVFSGSRIINGRFVAQDDGSLVTTYHDPNTIIDNPLATGADDETYNANPVVVPPKDTPVKVTIKRVKMEGEDKRVPIFPEAAPK